MNWDAEAFARLAVGMHDEPSTAQTLEMVLRNALTAVDCHYAGAVFVHGGNRVEVAGATDPRVRSLDEVQTTAGEGPDLEVLTTGQPVLVGDVECERRWPRWCAAVSGLGVRSLLAVPLSTSVLTVGTLTLYDRRPARFDRDDVAVAQILARHAAVALASARNMENLWRAVDARKVVGQAQGILMERYQLTADQAMAVLMRYSSDTGTKLRVIAESLVEGRALDARSPR